MWYYIIPQRLFYLGMNEAEVRKVIGQSYELVPIGIAFSSPPTEYERNNFPCYSVKIPFRGVEIHFNSFKKVVHISFLLGADKGNLILHNPDLKRPSGP